MKTLNHFYIFVILVIGVSLTGCLQLTPHPRGINSTEPILTPSSTPIALPTRTGYSTTTATAGTLPTYSTTEINEKVQELLTTNGGCELPCWWGITPGKTTWNEVINKLEPIAWKISDFKDHPIYKDKITREFYFAMDDQPTLINSLMINFVLDKKTLEINWIVSSQTYNLQSVLNSYGTPDTILINIAGLPAPGPASYDFNIVYSKNGIIAGGGRDVSIINRDGEDFAQICQTDFLSDARGLVVWDPKKELEFKDIFIQHESVDEYLPLNTVVGMPTKEFVEFILENDATNCLEFPMREWLN